MLDAIWKARPYDPGTSIHALRRAAVWTSSRPARPPAAATWLSRLRREFELWRWRRAYARRVDEL